MRFYLSNEDYDLLESCSSRILAGSETIQSKDGVEVRFESWEQFNEMMDELDMAIPHFGMTDNYETITNVGRELYRIYDYLNFQAEDMG